MREVITGFCEEYQYPPEAVQTLLKVYGNIMEGCAVRELFIQAREEYSQNPVMDYSQYLERLRCACREEGHFWETVSMLFYICLVPRLYQYYEERKLPASICRASLEDLKWKLWECRQVYGIWGSFVPDWFAGFFMLNRFTLGRLQFEPMPFPKDYECSGRKKPAGIQRALFVHIPSSGPLLHEDCIRAYGRAADFFHEYFSQDIFSCDKFSRDTFSHDTLSHNVSPSFLGGTTAFVCNSWLLFPEHRTFLPKHSRILEFMGDYDIYDSWSDPDGEDLWRIFGQPDCSDTIRLPERTSLQKAYKQWLLAGGTPGIGKGVLLWKKE